MGRCLICGSKNLYKYQICEECFSNFYISKKPIIKLNYLDELYTCSEYNHLFKKLLLDYKFREKSYYYKMFSEMIIERILEEKLLDNYKSISYVPMTKFDKQQRGYNQSYLIAEDVAKNLNLKLVKAVEKIRRTKEQAKIKDLELRRENIKDVFVPLTIEDSIIIIDDVVTTNSTLEEIARVLKENGTKKIAAIVAANATRL